MAYSTSLSMAGSPAVSKADDDPLDHDSDHDLIEDAIQYIAEKKYREGITNNRKRQIRTKERSLY